MSLVKFIIFCTVVTIGISAFADESILMMSYMHPSQGTRPVEGTLTGITLGRDGQVTADYTKGKGTESVVIAQINADRVKSIEDSFSKLTPVVRDPSAPFPVRCLACAVHEISIVQNDGTRSSLSEFTNADRLKSIMNGFERLAENK